MFLKKLFFHIKKTLPGKILNLGKVKVFFHSATFIQNLIRFQNENLLNVKCKKNLPEYYFPQNEIIAIMFSAILPAGKGPLGINMRLHS